MLKPGLYIGNGGVKIDTFSPPSRVTLQPVKTDTVSTSIPLLYDSGVLYDDPEAYYDLYYPVSGAPFTQGEIASDNVLSPQPRISTTENKPFIKVI